MCPVVENNGVSNRLKDFCKVESIHQDFIRVDLSILWNLEFCNITRAKEICIEFLMTDGIRRTVSLFYKMPRCGGKRRNLPCLVIMYRVAQEHYFSEGLPATPIAESSEELVKHANP